MTYTLFSRLFREDEYGQHADDFFDLHWMSFLIATLQTYKRKMCIRDRSEVVAERRILPVIGGVVRIVVGRKGVARQQDDP